MENARILNAFEGLAYNFGLWIEHHNEDAWRITGPLELRQEFFKETKQQGINVRRLIESNFTGIYNVQVQTCRNQK